MNNQERALSFFCGSEQLIGILHSPEQVCGTGLLIVVGGPQYRVGSHRQFVLLARFLAEHGIPVFRFDYRAMGDSDGEAVDFENVNQDIAAAMDCFLKEMPGLEKLVIWGLCDAASAALFYGYQDARVSGLILLNPWVRTDVSIAKTYLKSYYRQRLFSAEFWKKIFVGKLNVRQSIDSLVQLIKKSRSTEKSTANKTTAGIDKNMSLPDRMACGLRLFEKPVFIILSGNNDYVADEFRHLIGESEQWQALMSRHDIEKKEFPEANHTFSKREWRNQVEQWTLQWVKSL